MKNLTLLITLFFIMIGKNIQAEVWHSTQEWSNEWEMEYQHWVNKKLTTTIFTKQVGVLSGIATDCADALYDVRILFAYTHSLPFVINTPYTMNYQSKLFGSDTDMFDSIKDEKNRVRAFIRYINKEVGTENLQRDTFPIHPTFINSGTLYLVEWSFLGKVNRHSYIVKGFTPDHELLYYASDAPVEVRNLQVDTKYPRFSFDSPPFGFRQWKHPNELLIDESHIPKEEGYSLKQYDLASTFGKKRVLKEIRKYYQPNSIEAL